MPQFYRVLKADPLGDPYTPNRPNAKPLQSFWCQVAGVVEPVMMSKQVPNTPSLTEGHYGVLEDKVSQSGNAYKKFTSMQTPQGTQRPRYDAQEATTQSAPTATQADAQTVHPSDQKDMPFWFAPYAMKINYVYDQMKQVDQPVVGEPLPQMFALTEANKADEEAVETIGDTTITKDELEDIFGGQLADPVDLTKDN